MVGIVSGSYTGLASGSAGTLGQQGVFGNPALGSSGEAAYVNIANGNLMLRDQDEFIASLGSDLAMTRTYNVSTSTFSNGWRTGGIKQLSNLTGTVNTAGSTVSLTDGDYNRVVYTYDATLTRYVATDGGGGYNYLSANTSTQQWTWTSDRRDLAGVYEIYGTPTTGGLIKSRNDQMGVRLNYIYDNRTGQIQQITDASGDTLQFTWTGNNITQIAVKTADGATSTRTRYTFDASNRLSQVVVDLTPDDNSISDGNVYTTTYTYVDNTAQIAAVSQSDGTQQSFTYDNYYGAIRVKSATDGQGRVTLFSYDKAGQTTVTDSFGNKTVYTYDGASQLLSVTTPPVAGVSQTTSFTYDAKGNVLTVTDPRQLVTTYQYDANGNRVSETDTAGNRLTRSYDPVSNNLLSETRWGDNAAQYTTSYVYDVANRLRFIVSPEGRVQEFGYNTAGQRASMTAYSSALLPVGTAMSETALATWAGALPLTSSAASRTDYLYDGRGLVTSSTTYATSRAPQAAVAWAGTPPAGLVASGNNLAVTSTNQATSSNPYVATANNSLGTDIQMEITLPAVLSKQMLTIGLAAGIWPSNGQRLMAIFDSTGLTMQVQSGATVTYPWLGQLKAGATYVLEFDTSSNGDAVALIYEKGQDRATARIQRTSFPAGTQFQLMASGQNGPAAAAGTTGSTSTTQVSNITMRTGGSASNALSTRYVYDMHGQVLQSLQQQADGSTASTLYTYDSLGRRLSAQDALQNTTLTTYDGANRTVQQTQANGLVTSTVYDANGRVLITAQYDGNHTLLSSVTNSYDKNGMLRLVDAGNGQRTYYLVDAAGRKTGQIDANGNLTAYLYNADNQLIRTIAYAQPVATTSLLDADGNWRQLSAADLNPDATNSRSTWSAYDNAGRLAVTVDATGSVTRYVYDQASRLVQTIRRAKAADITLFGAAPLGAGFDTPAQTADQITRNYYDNDGLLRAVVDAAGYVSEYRYDAAGQRIETIIHQTALSATYLDGKPALAAMLTASGGVASHERYFYNSQNQLAATLDNANYLTVLSYDSNGNVLSRRRYSAPVTSPAAATLALLGYDPNGTYQGTTYTYTKRNQLDTETANDGVVTRYVYDQLGRLTTTRVSAGATAGAAASQRYDLQGNVLAELNAEGAAKLAALPVTATSADINAIWASYATTYTYNNHGLRLSATEPRLATDTVARETHYYYDALGNLKYSVNALGEVTALTYSGFNQLQSSTQLATRVPPDLLATLHGGQNDSAANAALEALRSATLDSTQRYEYDGDGHQTAVVDALGYRSTLAYDSFGQAIGSEQQSVANGNVSSPSTNPGGRKFYDADGRLSASLSTDGTLTSYSYNALNQLTDRITYARQVSYTISADDLAHKIADPAQADRAHDSHQRYYYNARGLLAATMTAEGIANGKLQWSVVKNDYDGNGNLSTRTAYATLVGTDDAAPAAALTPADADGDNITVYSYDAANRIRSTAVAQNKVAGSANRTWSISRNSYDALGRLQSATSFAAQRTGLAPTATELDAFNSVTNLNAVTWYSYDSAGRIKTVSTAQNASTTNNVTTVNWAVSERFYDALGQLQSTTQYATPVTTAGVTDKPGTATAAPAQDRVTAYSYDATGRLSMTTDTEGSKTRLDYDAKGNVITRTQLGRNAADNRVTRLYYDLDNRLLYSVDAEGGVTEQRYDTQGNVAASVRYAQPVNPGQLSEQLGSLTALLTKTDSADRTERYMYDSNHRLVYTIDGRGYLTERSYDAFGRVASIRTYPTPGQPASFTVAAVNQAKATFGTPVLVSFEYDAQGNLAKATDAMGFVESYVYDAQGHKTQYTNQLGNVWDYAYDAAGRLTMETAPPVTVYNSGDDQTATGAVVRLTTLLAYDGLGNLKSRTEAGNTSVSRLTSYGYDLAGHQVSTTSQAFANYVTGADPQSNIRNETAPIAPIVTVKYDMLGNAISNNDAAGFVSYKYYDRLGRVRDEVDAAGYLTHYDRNEFGDVIQLTRYATVLGDPKAPGSVDYSAPVLGTNDRTIKTQYDHQGRVIKVSEPLVLVYDQAGINGAHTYQSARTTDTRYNSFGEVYLQSVYGETTLGRTTAANTRFYYDQTGNKTDKINALQDTDSARAGYLTTYKYDGAGHLTEQLESAAAITGANAWSNTGYDKTKLIADNAGDHKTVYSYDNNNRKTSETRVGAQVGANNTLTDIVTRYDYDAVGNLTRTTSANGTATIQYYDALGRTTWLAQMAPTGDSTKMPVTELRMDAMGNVVVRIDYANGNPSSVPVVVGKPFTTPPPGIQPLNDIQNRITLTSYDRAGHATKLTDALNNILYRSYDRLGRVAKQWQSVTSQTPAGIVTETVFQVTRYDGLGRLQTVFTPGNIDLITAGAGASATVQTDSAYNAFGELITKTIRGGGKTLTEKTDYDNAGHAWRSNGDDGVVKVTLFDAQGNATLVMRSAAAPDDTRLSSISSAAETASVLTMGNIQRVDTSYDLLGHTVDISALHGNDLYFLTYQSNGNWTKQVLTPGAQMPEGLLIIGDSADLKSTLSVRYRNSGVTDWITMPSRIQQINGYVVFNTSGLTSGKYEYEVTVQPEVGEPYQRDGGQLSIASSEQPTKALDVIGMYLMIQGRPPEPAGLDYWINRLNNGTTLATVAKEMLSQSSADPLSAHPLTSGTTQAQLADIFKYNLGKDPANPAVTPEFNKWLAQMGAVSASNPDNTGQALVDLMHSSDGKLGRIKTAIYDYYIVGGGMKYEQAQAAALYANDISHTNFEDNAKQLAASEKSATQLARIYIALLGRAPNKSGFDWWLDKLNSKTLTAEQVAASFLVSDEWLTMVPAGSLSDGQFNEQLINRAYSNLLGRRPTAGEFAQWNTMLQSATPQNINAKRGEFIVAVAEAIANAPGNASSSFSASDRSHLFSRVITSLQYAAVDIPSTDIPTQIALGSAVLQGLSPDAKLSDLYNQVKLFMDNQRAISGSYAGAANAATQATPLETQQLLLVRLYAAALGRAPDATGFRNWTNSLMQGNATPVSVANDMLNGEGARLYPATMTSSAFVTALYQNMFGSAPSSEQVAKWTSNLTANSRGAVLVDMMNATLNAFEAGSKPGRDLFNSRVSVSLLYTLNANGNTPAEAATIYNAVTLNNGVVDNTAALKLLADATKKTAAAAAMLTATAAASAAALMDKTLQAAQALSAANTSAEQAQAIVSQTPMAAAALRAAQLYVAILNRGGPQVAGLDLYGFINEAKNLFDGNGEIDAAQWMIDSAEGKLLYADGIKGDKFVSRFYGIISDGGALSAVAAQQYVAKAATRANFGATAIAMLNDFLGSNKGIDATAGNDVLLKARQGYDQRLANVLSGLTSQAAAAAVVAQNAATAAGAELDAQAALTTADQNLTAAVNAAPQTNKKFLLDIARMFVGILNRDPGTPLHLDLLDVWIRAEQENHVSPRDIASQLVNSAEGQALYKNMDDATFLDTIFMQVLGHHPEPNSWWLGVLKSNGIANRGAVAWDIIYDITETTDNFVSEYYASAGFDQKVRTLLTTMYNSPATVADITNASLAATQALAAFNSADRNLQATRTEYINAQNASPTAYPVVIQAQQAKDSLNSPYLNDIIKLRVALSLPTDYSTIKNDLAAMAAGQTDYLYKIAASTGLSLGTSTAARSSFFKSLYSLVLWRTPDSDGFDFWMKSTITDVGQMIYSFVGGANELYNAAIYPARQRTDFNGEVSRALAAVRNVASSNYENALQAAKNDISANISRTQTAYSNAQTAYGNADAQLKDKNALYSYATQFGSAVKPAIDVLETHQTLANAKAALLIATAAKTDAVTTLGSFATGWSTAQLLDYTVAMQNSTKSTTPDYNLATALANVAGASIDMAANARDTAAAQITTLQLAQTIQMYTLLLNRAPTLQEVNVALQQYQNGTTLESLANDLIAANSARYPAGMSNTNFIIQLYLSFRDTAPPDDTGRQFWVTALNTRTRGQLVGDLIASLMRENINPDSVAFARKVSAATKDVASAAQASATNPDVAAFLSTTAKALQNAAQKADAAALAAMSPEARAVAQVVQLYTVLLGRGPEPIGMMNGIVQLAGASNANTSMLSIIDGMLNSPEFGLRVPASLTNADFVSALYQKVLGVTLDAGELGSISAKLDYHQIGRAQVALDAINTIYNYIGGDLDRLNARNQLQIRFGGALTATVSLMSNYSAVLKIDFSTSLYSKLQQAVYYHDGITPGIDNNTHDGNPIPVVKNNQTVDRWGNVVSQSDARDDNWTTTYQYNDANQLIATMRTGYVADASGVIQKTVLTTSTVYDSMGHALSTTDARHNTSSYRYDAVGTLLQEFHADNVTATASVLYTNDAFGQHTAETQNSGNDQSPAVLTTYEYDKLGHQTARITASVDMYYNHLGEQIKISGQSKDVYTYDELGRRTAAESSVKPVDGEIVSDPNAQTRVTTRYDLNGNIITTTDALGQQTLSAYDAFNHKLAEKQVETGGGGVTKSWIVDNYGRAKTFTGADGSLTSYTYNASGQLLTQAMTKGGTKPQDLAYAYEDGTGLLTSIDDKALNQLTTYTYDRAGNRLTEKVWLKLENRAVQDQTLHYDAFNRLTDITSTIPGADYKIHYTYDQNGNRLSESTAFTNDSLDKKLIVINYQYDAMNRQTGVSGAITTTANNPPAPPTQSGSPLDNDNPGGEPPVDPNADQITSVTAHTITYDWVGNRTSDTAVDRGATSIESYRYDTLGRLSQVTDKFGNVIGERHYDSAGRVIYSLDKGGEQHFNDYDRLGRLTQQVVYNGGIDHIVNYDVYDRYNNLKAYTVTTGDGRQQKTEINYDLSRDGYRQVWTVVSNMRGNQDTKTTKQEYDVNGNLRTLAEYDKINGTRGKLTSYVSDSDGHVVEKNQSGLVTHSLIANGQLVGSSNANYESFSSGYIPATAQAATNAPSVYVVQNAGETLLSVAKAIYGDQNLWYLIADANGGIGSELTVGQQLVIPSRVNTVTNNYQSFKPYDKGEAIGATAPELAMPAAQDGGADCGPIGKVIAVAIAVAVTVVTGNALLGNLASQLFSMVTSQQESFSFKSAALAYVGQSVSDTLVLPGEGGNAVLSWESDMPAAIARAAVVNAGTQTIGVMTGLQDGFSWRSVAASAAGAGVGATVGSALNGANWFNNAQVNRFAQASATSFASGLTTAMAQGGRIAVVQIATDAFGNALGSSLAQANWGGSDAQTDAYTGTTQTNSAAEIRAAGLSLPTGTRFLVQPESDEGGISQTGAASASSGSSGPLTGQFDLTDQSNFKGYLDAVNNQRVSGAPLDPQDVATSKALLFYYQGYAMGESKSSTLLSGTRSEQLSGSLDDAFSPALGRALDAFSASSPTEQTNRYNFYSAITSVGDGSSRARTVSVFRDDRELKLNFSPSFSDYAKEVGVSADEALRKTDFSVYQKVIDAGFATSGIKGINIEGTWRPSVDDYLAITNKAKAPYSKTSLHISNLALDISGIEYSDAGKTKTFSVANGGYSFDDKSKHYNVTGNAPSIFNDFRSNINASGGLREIYDPWSMQRGSNTRSNSPLKLNPSDLDYLHHNHLHISLSR